MFADGSWWSIAKPPMTFLLDLGGEREEEATFGELYLGQVSEVSSVWNPT